MNLINCNGGITMSTDDTASDKNKPWLVRIPADFYHARRLAPGEAALSGVPEEHRAEQAAPEKQAPAPAPLPMPTTETVRDQVAVNGVTLRAYVFGRVSYAIGDQPEVRLGNDALGWTRGLITALREGA